MCIKEFECFIDWVVSVRIKAYCPLTNRAEMASDGGWCIDGIEIEMFTKLVVAFNSNVDRINDIEILSITLYLYCQIRDQFL